MKFLFFLLGSLLAAPAFRSYSIKTAQNSDGSGSIEAVVGEESPWVFTWPEMNDDVRTRVSHRLCLINYESLVMTHYS